MPRPLAGLPREVGVLALIAFCVALGFGILAPALPVFARSFGVSALAASSIISVFALVRLVTSPLAGFLVDRLGERLILAVGIAIVAVSSAAAGFSQDFMHLLVLRGIGGLGSSMFTVSALALLLRVVREDQRGRAASVYQGGFLLGGVAGPAVGGLVVAVSIRAPFFVYAATLGAATVVALVMLAKAQLRDRQRAADNADGGLRTLRQALRQRAYRAVLAVNFMTGFVAFGLRSAAIPLFVTEGLGRGPSLAGICFLIAACSQAVLLLRAGRFADTTGRRPALILGTTGVTVGMVALSGADLASNSSMATLALALLLGAMVIQGLGSAFLGSAPAAVIGDISGGRRSGIVVATFQMMSDAGTILGPLIAGLLIDKADFDWAFLVGTLVAAGALLAVLRMPETLKRRMPTAAEGGAS